jgi:hypothetical protein
MTIAAPENQPLYDGWTELLYAWQMPWRLGAQWWELYAEALHVACTHPPHAEPHLFSSDEEPLHVEDEEGLCA